MNAKIVATDFPVVCVGGSAGGLDAYTRLLRHLPADMGVAIVIVNHLRTVATLLHEILPDILGCRSNLSQKDLISSLTMCKIIAVIVSGYDGDGAETMRSIK